MLEQEVAQFDMKYAKKFDDDAKELALKSITPEDCVVRQVCSGVVQHVRGVACSHYELGC